MFVDGFAMSEVTAKQGKQSRGEVAARLSAHILHDTQIGPNGIPKWLQIWSQNGIRNCVKLKLHLLMPFGAKMNPKMEPKWNQNCSQVWAGAILGPLGAILGPRGAILGPLEAILGNLGASLGPFWSIFGTILGPLWDHLGVSIGPYPKGAGGRGRSP